MVNLISSNIEDKVRLFILFLISLVLIVVYTIDLKFIIVVLYILLTAVL